MELTFRLDIFEGPLDLLLHLIAKNKVKIDDIPIALILDQYLDYLDRLSSFHMEITSDFIVMAAHLILIKSKMLLPEDEKESLDDPRMDLAKRLAEHKFFKSVSSVLGQMQFNTGERYIKQPELLENDGHYEYYHLPIELLKAISACEKRDIGKDTPSPDIFTGITGTERLSVEEAATRIISFLKDSGRQNLMDLLTKSGSRSSAVATFLALLDLCKENSVILDNLGFVDIL